MNNNKPFIVHTKPGAKEREQARIANEKATKQHIEGFNFILERSISNCWHHWNVTNPKTALKNALSAHHKNENCTVSISFNGYEILSAEVLQGLAKILSWGKAHEQALELLRDERNWQNEKRRLERKHGKCTR